MPCGLPRCPLLKLYEPPKQSTEKIEAISFGTTLFGPAPQIFIGDKGYPNVISGPLTSLQPDSKLALISADPSKWVKLPLNEILELRFGLLRGMKALPINVIKARKYNSKVLESLQEIAMATNAVDLESSYSGKINPSMNFDSVLSPQGPKGMLEKLDVAGHAKIPRVVERTLEDELLAVQQVTQLASSGIDVYYLQNILSAGLTGHKTQAKVVPTRWSITAVDDMVGKSMIRNLRDFKIIENLTVLHGGFFGNYFTIILFPESWKFENFETWMKGSVFALGGPKFTMIPDHEEVHRSGLYQGKVKYSIQSGGYYAARYSILKYLNKIRRQAKVVSIREITSEYLIPSGVWVVREAASVASNSKPITFDTKVSLHEYLREVLIAPLSEYYKQSSILAQSSIQNFF